MTAGVEEVSGRVESLERLKNSKGSHNPCGKIPQAIRKFNPVLT